MKLITDPRAAALAHSPYSSDSLIPAFTFFCALPLSGTRNEMAQQAVVSLRCFNTVRVQMSNNNHVDVINGKGRMNRLIRREEIATEQTERWMRGARGKVMIDANVTLNGKKKKGGVGKREKKKENWATLTINLRFEPMLRTAACPHSLRNALTRSTHPVTSR